VSTATTPAPAKPQERTNGDGLTLAAYLARTDSDGHCAEQAAAADLIAQAVEICGRYVPLKRQMDDVVMEGCRVNLALRRLCLRDDNGDPDRYGQTRFFQGLWRDYTGTGTEANQFRSAVASRLSLELMVQTDIARDIVATQSTIPGSASGKAIPKTAAKELPSAAELEELITGAKELPTALSQAVDKVLERQVYLGKGEKAGQRVQGAEQPIKSFGRRPKAAKKKLDEGGPDSAATGGNASAGTPQASWDHLLGSNKETLASQALNLFRQASRTIERVMAAEPGADRSEAVEHLNALAEGLGIFRLREADEKIDGKAITVSKVKAVLYQAPPKK